MRHILKAFTSLDSLSAEKARVIAEQTKKDSSTKYDDNTVWTKTSIYIFAYVQIPFPMEVMNAYPFDVVYADEVIARLDDIKEKIVARGLPDTSKSVSTVAQSAEKSAGLSYPNAPQA